MTFHLYAVEQMRITLVMRTKSCKYGFSLYTWHAGNAIFESSGVVWAPLAAQAQTPASLFQSNEICIGAVVNNAQKAPSGDWFSRFARTKCG